MLQLLESELAVCLWIPLFPLRCEERRRPELGHRPATLVHPNDIRRIWQVSALARRAGVRPGMTVSQGIGLCPPLAVIEPDPVHYDEQFAALLFALEDVSPVIEPAELGTAFVGVDGLERLFGAPERQLAAIYRAAAAGEAAGAAAAMRLGWARGKFAAWVAATRAVHGGFFVASDAVRERFLAEQSVAVLPVGPDTHRRLRQLGIETLGALARLPETALAAQFGREGRLAWRLASGKLVEPVVGRERPEPITAAFDFPAPVADRTMLAHGLHRLIERALAHPRRTGWRVRAVRARAALEHGASWLAEATLKDPSADCARIGAPLKVRLEQSPPAGAVERLAVEFTAFARGTEELQLFARDAQAAARAGRRRALRAAAREIRSRLKRARLYHVVAVQPQSRIPERRYALMDFEP